MTSGSSKMIFYFPDSEDCARRIATALKIPVGECTLRSFPDQETYLRILSSIKNTEIILVASLHHPNEKIMPLILFAETAKQLGAKRIGLVAPYLAYMRQDKAFHPGEALSAQTFAKWLSKTVNWIITVEPHLHRITQLDSIFSIPAYSVHVDKTIASWISEHSTHPFLIGPDSESQPWIQSIAHRINAPFVVAHKIRRGDQAVEIQLPSMAYDTQHTPILVDDIISTGTTLLTIQRLLKKRFKNKPLVIAVHGLFSEKDYKKLLRAPFAQLLTCNTIVHPSNAIDISDEIVAVIKNKILK